MKRTMLSLGLVLALTALPGCGQSDLSGNVSNETKELAKSKTIAAGLDENGRFMAAAKAAGLDATLAGPGPYTVLVPEDAAFGKLPAGTYDNWLKPESRAQLTQVLTYHILPGVVLAEDFAKAVDNGKGKAVMATMGGGTLTATKDGDKIVLTDSSGGKATIAQADDKYSNGVVQRIDAVLSPPKETGGTPPQAPGSAPGQQ
jgi:uncharacterized surface protein with fasciclin (FAS1) repeats